jgi:hypothetical protein
MGSFQPADKFLRRAVIDREAREAGSRKALEKVNKPGKL